MVDEKDMPIEEARCWMINGTGRAVDVYVNYADQPRIEDVEPLSIGPVLTIDGSADLPYGTYTFEARPRDDPDDPPLASASVELDEGDSFSAVLHRIDASEYRLSVYRNDYSPSENARLVVRHNAGHERIDWRISQNGETPEIPDDPRSGTLERGQWQEAADVTENEYRLEIVVDGEVVAFRQDLELELNRMIVVYLVDDPKPWMGSDEKEDHIFRQEFQIRTGPQREDAVTPPAEPVSTTDRNRPIRFDGEPLELFHTNHAEAQIGATDPDGIVSGLAVDEVEPHSDGFSVPDEGIDVAHAIGGTTTGTLQVRPKVPPASYDVRIAANPEGLGERVTWILPVDVEKITVDRLRDLVDRYHEADEMTVEITTELRDLLDDAAAHLDADEFSEACEALEAVVTVVGENKDEGIGVTATVDIETETEALRERLGCG